VLAGDGDDLVSVFVEQSSKTRTRLARRCMGGPHERRHYLLVDVACVGRLWHIMRMDATVVMGKQGRLVIPAEVRKALGLAPGDELHLHLAGRRLVLERPEDAVAELRRLGSKVSRSRSLVEELLAERRLAAATE
jgi:antitoxin PrlF